MKTSRSPGSSERGVAEERRACGRRRPDKKNPADAQPSCTNIRSQIKSSASVSGGQSPATCRLCHGTFSPRSLRHAFNKWSPDSVDVLRDASCSPPSTLFHADFQRLVGVRLDPDPRLSEFVCKKCHSKFYKCHNILIGFLQTVNVPPVAEERPQSRPGPVSPEASVKYGPTSSPSLSSDPACLHKLVSWAHHHGEACRSCPALKEVLEGRCWGFVKAVWCCVDGHSYTMDTPCGHAPVGGGPAVTPRSHGSAPDGCGSEDPNETPAPTLAPQVDSDVSDRSEEECEGRGKSQSEDDLFETYSDQRADKPPQMSNVSWEPKVKKKPGPKPGWKKKLKAKGEELPNIYKCLYEGCSAVYRAPDGLKKHRKEHHDKVRERPCPHPGCNKVFTIDRYLQRHIKLIHTEERNYICDQCGQTFKQRKHLSVHQMRHSGAKPLQCEVCGFQCRQRASLKYHMTKHMAEADLEFACMMCSKRFEKAHNLNVHMSMVHPLTQRHVHKEGLHQ
nr:zinc finger protein 276 isoform X2 [Doryrhamphus excisus]XP_057943267.1 zinc finger protein 276 isoform X2 [Doryrhamphus excisus]XP_057943268.1 zinc finger protein 276 isoform X2 [Doryrhamphus excisus]XP_057943269.1 zinc finger protein 276 isoform X2 [Doryrhamphus excisus]XP_057943270.1 zinc finger protein 276 isoform X2 [Doryrhamphus excisus]